MLLIYYHYHHPSLIASMGQIRVRGILNLSGNLREGKAAFRLFVGPCHVTPTGTE